MSKTANDSLESLLANGGTSAMTSVGGYTKDPHLFDFKRELGNLGNYVTFRVLNVNPNFVQSFPAVKVSKKNTKTGAIYANQIVILPDDAKWREHCDAIGTELKQCPTTEVKRMLVYVVDKQCAKKGEEAKLEPVGKLMYMEFPNNMVIAYNNLNANAENCSPWNPTTNLPEYDIKIYAVMGSNGMKNYNMAACVYVTGKDGMPSAHPNFKKSASDVIGANADKFKEDFPLLSEKMKEPPSLQKFLQDIGSTSAGLANATAQVSADVSSATSLSDIIS